MSSAYGRSAIHRKRNCSTRDRLHGAEAGLGGRQHAVDVGLGMRGAQEHVVARVQVGAVLAAPRRRRRRRGGSPRRRRTAAAASAPARSGAARRPAWRRAPPTRGAAARPAPRCAPPRPVRTSRSSVATAAAIGTAAHQNEPVTKTRAAASRSASTPGHGGQRMAVGDRLAPGGQVRAHAHRLPAAGRVQAEAGAHVVHDQRRAAAVADGARGAGEGRVGQLLVAPQSCRKAVTMMPARSLPAASAAASRLASVVVVEAQQVGAVVRRGAGRHRRAPGRRAVIGRRAPPGSLRRPVAARAMVTQAVVASVPFFWNIAQSAWAMRSTRRSASSTMTGAGPFRQSPSAAWRAAASSTTGSW